MSKVRQLRDMLKLRLTAADKEIFELFEGMIRDYEEEIHRLKEENKGGKVLDAVFNPQVRLYREDMQQLLLIKEEILTEQQEWNLSVDQEDIKEQQEELWLSQQDLSVDQEDIKEEQEELWLSQQGQQLHQLEEADITKFPFTAVPLKSENDKKPQLSQLHQSQSDETTEARPVASGTTAHRTLTAQADGEYYGGPQPARISVPDSHLQADTNGRSSDISETQTDYSCEWKQSRELHLDFNCLKNSNVCVSHSRCHVAKKQFNVSHCDKAYGHMNYSKQNTGLQASENPFGCPECGKRFGIKSNLIAHMTTHTGEKLFVCSDCGKRFVLKGTLVRHMRIHTGEKPFDCSECGAKFRRKSHLIAHMIIHTKEKLFVCSECGKRFGHKGNMIRHMIVHTGEKPFGCSECGAKFRRKGNLVEHMVIHTGEKPFDCSECGKRFAHEGNLIRHMAIHTGQKPFGCSECGKKFGQKVNLIRHVKIHAGEKPFGS